MVELRTHLQPKGQDRISLHLRARAPVPYPTPAAGLRRRQPHFGGADFDLHCALFAGSLATASGQFQRLRRQSRLPGEVLPQIRFPAAFQDHLPLRRTAGAHQQQRGAVGCRFEAVEPPPSRPHSPQPGPQRRAPPCPSAPRRRARCGPPCPTLPPLRPRPKPASRRAAIPGSGLSGNDGAGSTATSREASRSLECSTPRIEGGRPPPRRTRQSPSGCGACAACGNRRPLLREACARRGGELNVALQLSARRPNGAVQAITERFAW